MHTFLEDQILLFVSKSIRQYFGTEETLNRKVQWSTGVVFPSRVLPVKGCCQGLRWISPTWPLSLFYRVIFFNSPEGEKKFDPFAVVHARVSFDRTHSGRNSQHPFLAFLRHSFALFGLHPRDFSTSQTHLISFVSFSHFSLLLFLVSAILFFLLESSLRSSLWWPGFLSF